LAVGVSVRSCLDCSQIGVSRRSSTTSRAPDMERVWVSVTCSQSSEMAVVGRWVGRGPRDGQGCRLRGRCRHWRSTPGGSVRCFVVRAGVPGVDADRSRQGGGGGGAKRCRLKPIKEFVAMVEAHWEGFIAWQTASSATGYSRAATPWSRQPNAGLEATDPGQDDPHHLPHHRQAPTTRNPHDLARSPYNPGSV